MRHQSGTTGRAGGVMKAPPRGPSILPSPPNPPLPPDHWSDLPCTVPCSLSPVPCSLFDFRLGCSFLQPSSAADDREGMERRIELGTRNRGQRTGNGPRRKGDDIAERLLDAVEGVRQRLPGLRLDAASKHVAKQLWRATTPVKASRAAPPQGYTQAC